MNLLSLIFLLTVPFQAQDPPKKQETHRKIEWVKEPDTGVKYPDAIKSDLFEGYQTLAGLAVRDKRFVILVNVYAYGLYLDEKAVESQLGDFCSLPAKELWKSEKFYSALGKDEIGRTLKLYFVRDVGAKKIRDAFVDSVEPRIELAAKKYGWIDGGKALATFRGYFSGEIKEGEQIEFTWLPGHKLVTTVAGKRLGTLTSKALCWALWDTYYGEDPVETEGKKTSVEILAKLLEKTPKPKPKPEPKPEVPPAPKKE